MRLVRAKWTTLGELETLTFDRVDLWCQALDVIENAEQRAS